MLQEVTQASLGAVSTELKLASSKLESDRVDKAKQVMDLHREVAQNVSPLHSTRVESSRVQPAKVDSAEYSVSIFSSRAGKKASPREWQRRRVFADRYPGDWT